MVIFGIKPSRIETAYGYIKASETSSNSFLKVYKFIEKPKKSIAKRLIKFENVFWNSGIFVWKASVLLEQIRKFMPRLYFVLCQEGNSLKKGWQDLEPISIDYGILEKSKKNLYVARFDCGWTDLGNWSTLDLVLKKDKNNNAIAADAITVDTINTTIWGGHHLIVALGLKDMIVADTPDALLVCPKEYAQRVSEVVEILKSQNRIEYLSSRLVNRPWGSYFVLNESKGFKIKIVDVFPHRRLSLQLHHKRSEHWIIVKGIATVTIENKIYKLKSNQSIYVPAGSKHRVANEQDKQLTFIEVQVGSYLGEDDIERFEDDYERHQEKKNCPHHPLMVIKNRKKDYLI